VKAQIVSFHEKMMFSVGCALVARRSARKRADPQKRGAMLRCLQLSFAGMFLLWGCSARASAPLGSLPFAAVTASLFDANLRGSNNGHHVAIVSGGYDALLLRVYRIRQAKTSIAVQAFIWGNDECGRLIMYELIEAARRGVKVRIIAYNLFSEQ